MQVGRAEGAHSPRVRRRDVPDVRDEAVPRVESVEATHDPISHDLGHDRGGRNRCAASVPVHDRLVRRCRRPESKSVDEAGVCRGVEIPENGAQSREVQAVQPRSVDLARGHDPDAHAGRSRQHGLEENLAVLSRHLLGVVQCRERSNPRAPQQVVVEEHTGDDERPCERAAAGFVGPRHIADTKTSIEPEETLAGGSSHAADNTGYFCRSSRTRAFFPTLLRK